MCESCREDAEHYAAAIEHLDGVDRWKMEIRAAELDRIRKRHLRPGDELEAMDLSRFQRHSDGGAPRP